MSWSFSVCLVSMVVAVGGAPAASEGGATSEVEGEGGTSAGGQVEAGSEVPAEPRAEARWIHRYRPEPKLVELGVMAGVYVPGANHELFEVSRVLPDQGFQALRAAPELGLRVGYAPLAVLGAELEGAVMLSRAEAGGSATLWTVRGGVVGQLPWWRVVPFGVVGVGALGVRSDRAAVGRDVDPSLYFGVGAKANVTRRLQVRLDLRDVVSHKLGPLETFENHNFEALLSVALVLGRPRPAAPPVVVAPPSDRDGDGWFDEHDACPAEPGGVPDGCPPRDTDGDGFFDHEDCCDDEPGVAPNGCPALDPDGDGFLAQVDDCPDEAGVRPDGCPTQDRDGDGLMDPEDQCVDEPETRNGFQDADGCPDEVPPEVIEYTGVIEGIQFEFAEATIRDESEPTLKAAVRVLRKYPSIHVEITGHTDDEGARERNLRLSLARANAVRKYLVGHGVDQTRIATRGAGPDEPIADNGTKAGRAKNRRIEFHIIRQ